MPIFKAWVYRTRERVLEDMPLTDEIREKIRGATEAMVAEKYPGQSNIVVSPLVSVRVVEQVKDVIAGIVTVFGKDEADARAKVDTFITENYPREWAARLDTIVPIEDEPTPVA